MTEWLPFLLAVLALLATPGPTNTLVAAAGAGRGVVASLPLLAGELGGYAVAITLWTEVVGAAAATQPTVFTLSKLIAAAFLLWSAAKLWRLAGTDELPRNVITIRRVFVTTLLNPKALVLAFGIFPAVGFAGRLPYLAAFGGLVIATAVSWMAFGALVRQSSKGRLTLRTVDRIAAVVLMVFAGLIAASALR